MTLLRTAIGIQSNHRALYQSERVDISQRVYDFQKLLDGPPTVYRDSEHFAEHRDAHLKSDTGQKSKQDRLGKKIGEKAKPKNAPQEQQSSGLHPTRPYIYSFQISAPIMLGYREGNELSRFKGEWFDVFAQYASVTYRLSSISSGERISFVHL